LYQKVALDVEALLRGQRLHLLDVGIVAGGAPEGNAVVGLGDAVHVHLRSIDELESYRARLLSFPRLADTWRAAEGVRHRLGIARARGDDVDIGHQFVVASDRSGDV